MAATADRTDRRLPTQATVGPHLPGLAVRASGLTDRGRARPNNEDNFLIADLVTNVLGGPECGVHVDVGRLTLRAGDAVLLCSDGLTDMLDDGRVAAVLAAAADPGAACRRLVDEANAAGGRDNVTAVVARLDAA